MIVKLSLLCLLVSFAPAASERFVVQQWKVEHGLPQSSVRCISQTTDGYIWIGTWNGLARFDGVRMKTFKPANTPALLTGNIMSLFTDRRGILWIGTDAGGLVRYAGGKFERIDSARGITATRILSINEDSSGRLWCATESGVFVSADGRFLHFDRSSGLPLTYANQILPLPDGTVYVGFVGTGAMTELRGDSISVKEFFPVGGYAVTADRSGTIWYCAKGRGFVRRHKGIESVDPEFAGVRPGETYILRNGEKWLLTPDDLRIITDTLKTSVDFFGPVSTGDLSTVFEDREGNIWLGKDGGGLIQLRRKQVSTLSTANGFGADIVLCGMQDSDGAVWIGTWDGGLKKRKPGPGRSFVSVPLPDAPSSIYTLLQSRDGTIWIGTWGKGVYTIRGKTIGRFTGGILTSSTSIISIVEDLRGGMWIGTAHEGVVQIAGDSVTVWNTSTGLPSNRVNAILAASDGAVWVSLSANGVVRIDSGIATSFKKGSGLLDNSAAPMYEDALGSVWIGTNRGLARWNNGTFAHVTEAEGLFDESIAQIIEDDAGNFWIGGIHGIYRVPAVELNAAADGSGVPVRCFTIGKDDGMLNEETSGGGTARCWKTDEGMLWFSTSQGVVLLDPRSVSSTIQPPTVMVEEVWVENRPRPLSDVITLSPGETKIEIQYTGINFSAPKKIRFSYLLEGFEERWNDAGTNRLAQYTNLDPGEYQFSVSAENSVGTKSVSPATLRIVVLPPLHATWWFRTAGALLFVGSIVFALRRRFAALEREKQRNREFTRRLIESQESERKRIANELHDSLGQNLLVIKNTLLVKQREIPSVAEGLNDVSALVSGAIQEVRSISHHLRPHQLDQLGLTKTLRALVKNIGVSSSIRFTAEIAEIDGVLTGDEEISLFRIVQESFNNILKHSGATTASVSVTRSDGAITVTITDNGKGIAERRNGNERESVTFESYAGPAVDRHAGFGISGMLERAKMFGWNCVIHSSAVGTVVTVTIAVHRRSPANT